MYNFTLFLHSWSRWLVLILAVIAIFKAMAGWLGKQPFSKQDNILGASFVGSMHLQLLLGYEIIAFYKRLARHLFYEFSI